MLAAAATTVTAAAATRHVMRLTAPTRHTGRSGRGCKRWRAGVSGGGTPSFPCRRCGWRCRRLPLGGERPSAYRTALSDTTMMMAMTSLRSAPPPYVGAAADAAASSIVAIHHTRQLVQRQPKFKVRTRWRGAVVAAAAGCYLPPQSHRLPKMLYRSDLARCGQRDRRAACVEVNAAPLVSLPPPRAPLQENCGAWTLETT